MDPASDQVSERISALLEELIDLVKPEHCGDPECDHDHMPEGPWMITGWALAVDCAAEQPETGEVETWTGCFRSKNLPRTQCHGLGATIMHWSGV